MQPECETLGGDTLAEVFCWRLARPVGDQLDALHQATASDVADALVARLQLELSGPQPLTPAGGGGNQTVPVDHPE